MGNQWDRSFETSKSTTAFSFSSAIEEKKFFAKCLTLLLDLLALYTLMSKCIFSILFP